MPPSSPVAMLADDVNHRPPPETEQQGSDSDTGNVDDDDDDGEEEEIAEVEEEDEEEDLLGFSHGSEDRDSPTDARNILLVVATLIATVTFQAGVNPPGGVWQDEGNGHVPGRAIYASQKHAYYVFLISNTIALSTSIPVIISLTHRFPFQFEILTATISMLVTYGSAIFAVTPEESVKFRYVLTAAALPFILRCLLKGFYTCRGMMAD